MNIHKLIEAVKYGEDVAPYGPNFREDLLDALEEVETLQERLDELGEHLVANPAAFKIFVEIMNRLEKKKAG